MASTIDRYAAERDRADRLRSAAVPDYFSELRDEAWRRFTAVGFPTTRNEEWRFTSTAPIAQGTFRLAPDAGSSRRLQIDPFRVSGAAVELVFVNGHFVEPLSRTGALPPGAYVGAISSAGPEQRRRLEQVMRRVVPIEPGPFAALNGAFLEDGAWVDLPAGAVVNQPVHLMFLTTGLAAGEKVMTHPRVLATLGDNSEAVIIETYAGLAGAEYFTNAVSEVALSDQARLQHYKLQYETAAAYHIGAIAVRAERGAVYTSHSISLGGALVRNDLTSVLSGEGAECTLNGLYSSDQRRLIDNHTTIDHARPHCSSREIYKGILADHASGVFNGKIIVRPDAQKTDAKQTNRALLLSEDARINTKPQLEIFANDVKCTHGAAVGQLDDEALFYLRSRGISVNAARQMLIHAFAADVLNRMPHDTVREAVERRLQRQLSRARLVAAREHDDNHVATV